MSFKSKLSLFAAVLISTFLVPAVALAQAAAPSNAHDTNMGLAIGAGIAIGLAALGGTLGQGKGTAAALEGISRNPGAAARIQTPMILGLALIESLVLFAFVIAFLLQGNVTVGG